MKIETKYDLGQTVFAIEQQRVFKWVPCVACNGKGNVKALDKVLYRCPCCDGKKGADKAGPVLWMISGSFKVIAIDIDVDPKPRLRYRGKTANHLQANLFRSRAAAKIAATKRNA